MVTIRISSRMLSIGIIALLLAVVMVLGYNLYFPKTGSATYNVGSNVGVKDLNVFEGRITNVKVSPGKIQGISAYDNNCVGDRITECDGGIQTLEYGLLNFHYSHEMSKQPCIHMFGPENLIVEILDSAGNARVTRTLDLSDMAGHHG